MASGLEKKKKIPWVRPIFPALGLLFSLLVAAHTAWLLRRPNVVALCLHRVGANSSDGYDPWTIALETFEEILKQVERSGRKALLTQDLMAPDLGDSGSGGILLTFDDANPSDWKTVVPRLQEKRLPATFFWPSHLLGTSAVHRAQAKSLTEMGFSIQSHSVTHKSLFQGKKETLEAYRKRVQWELSESQKKISGETGARVDAFAYPRGEYTLEAVKALASTGYQFAFTTEYDSIHSLKLPFLLPRFMVTSETRLEQVKEFLEQPQKQLRRRLLVSGAVVLLCIGILFQLRRFQS